MLNRAILGIWYQVLILGGFTSYFIFHLCQSYQKRNIFLKTNTQCPIPSTASIDFSSIDFSSIEVLSSFAGRNASSLEISASHERKARRRHRWCHALKTPLVVRNLRPTQTEKIDKSEGSYDIKQKIPCQWVKNHVSG